MNEQLKDFLKKASEDESIKDELKALEGLSAEENAEQAAAIARKAGFDLSAEDFAPHRRNSMKTSWRRRRRRSCCCQYTGLGLVNDRGAVCECPTTGTGIRRDTGEVCEITSICRFMGESARRGRDCGCISLGGVLEEPPPVAACETRKRRWAARARDLGVERWSVLIR